MNEKMASTNIKNEEREYLDIKTKALIAAVKKNPVIWDEEHPERNNQNSHEYAWQAISEETGFSVEDSKKGWKSVLETKLCRDHVLNLRSMGSDSDDDSSTIWTIKNDLLFLDGKKGDHRTLTTTKESECKSLDVFNESNPPSPNNEKSLVAPITLNECVTTTSNTEYFEMPKTSGSVSNSALKRKKRRQLNKGLTKSLIKAVQNNPAIWQKEHPGHFSKIAHKYAWENVSKVMSLSIDDCKATWRSVRDSKRYYENKLKKSDCEMEEDDGWVFHDELSFLEGNILQRGSVTSTKKSEKTVRNEISNAHEEHDEVLSPDRNVKNETLNKLTSAADKIVTQLENLVQIQTNQAQENSKFGPVLNLLGSILLQLPEVDSQVLSAELTSLAYAKLNAHVSKYVKIEYT